MPEIKNRSAIKTILLMIFSIGLCAFAAIPQVHAAHMNGGKVIQRPLRAMTVAPRITRPLRAMTIAPTSTRLFAPALTLPAGSGARDLLTGDWNEDGNRDLAVLNYYDDNVTILNGNGAGMFYVGNEPPAGSHPHSMATEDFNGDGHFDLVATSYYNDKFRVLLGNGAGQFTTHNTYNTGDNPTAVDAGDLDGDEDIDLVVASYRDYEYIVEIFKNKDGTGVFECDGNFTVYYSPRFLLLNDLDNDEDLDLAVSCSYRIGILEWEDGNFTDPVYTYVPGSTSSLAAGHLNDREDRHIDLVSSDSSYDEATILKGFNDCSFDVVNRVDVGNDPYSVTVGDINLDGHMDLALANTYSDDVSVLLGKGNFEFREAMLFDVGDNPSAIALLDFDKDSDLDIATANFYDGTVSLLRNNTQENNSIVTGPGKSVSNPPLVRVFNTVNPIPFVDQWYAYAAYQYGVNVAAGNLDDHWGFEVVTGPGPGHIFGPHVRGFENNGTSLYGVSFIAYGTSSYGVNVNCGDIDGDDFDEIITAPGPGYAFGPHVRAWNWDGEGPVTPCGQMGFLAYGANHWGARAACGDIDGDGYDEIITGPGPGPSYAPHVRGWNCDGDTGPVTPLHQVSFFAYNTRSRGANVSSGDIDGDHFHEIVTGPGPSAYFGPHVRGWNWDGGPGRVQPMPGVSFSAYSQNYTHWGVNVSCGRINSDVADDIVTGAGPGHNYGSWVRAFNFDGSTMYQVSGINFFAYQPNFFRGVNVSVPNIK